MTKNETKKKTAKVAVKKVAAKKTSTKSTTKKETTKKVKVAPKAKTTVKKSKVEPKKAVKTTTKKTKAVSTKKAKVATTKKASTKKAKETSKVKKVKTAAAKKEPSKKVTKKSSTAKVTKKSSKSSASTTKVKAEPKKAVKTASRKNGVKKSSPKIDLLEYYDLPYRYNQTIVKVLAQTPKTLFVYWDISDDDRKAYVDKYGENFFETTKPVLIITNTTMNYTFEIEINDFANCWYFNINDEKCEYTVELGRRPKEYNNSSIPNNYMYITSSNKIESPNGHILFEKAQSTIYFRNVKTNETYSKDIANLNFIMRLGRIYKLYDIYHKLYKEDEFLKGRNNPTSIFF